MDRQNCQPNLTLEPNEKYSADNVARPVIRSSRLLLRMVAVFLISGILLTGFLLLLANTLVSRIVAHTSDRAAEAQLAMSSRAAYYVLTDVYGDFYTLWAKNPDIKSAFDASVFSKTDDDRISNLLDAAAFADTLVDSVCLINADADRVISNRLPASSLASYADPGAVTLFRQFEQKYTTAKQEIFFPRRAVLRVDGQMVSRNYISLIYATLADDNRLHSGIIVNIDQTRLTSLVNSDKGIGQMIIVNRSGQIICDSSGVNFADQLPSVSLFQSIATSGAASGSLVADYDGEQSLINYQKADTLNFFFLNIIPYAQLMQPVRQINQIMALLFGAAILLSLLISILSARQIYRPLDRLIRALQSSPAVTTDTSLEDYAYLQSAFGNLVARSEQASLLRLLQGGSLEPLLEMLNFSRPSFLAVALTADPQELPEQADDAWLDQVCQIAQRTIRLPAAVLPGHIVAILFNADEFDEVALDWLTNQLADLQQAVHHATGRSAAIGIGSVVNDPAAIKTSLQNAQSAAQYATTLGPGQIVPYGEIQNNPLAANQNRATITAAIDSYIQDNFTRPGFSLEAIADHIGLSVGYLRQIFKLERGLPLNDYIIACRIRKACDLLADSDMTAKDISEAVGYLDSRYFYTLFKKKTGMTTDEYRRTRRQEDIHDPET